MTEITATRLTGINATETNASTSLFFIFIEMTISVEGGQIIVSIKEARRFAITDVSARLR
nr:hypothetical protein [uncultured Pseudomonas sp.]